MMQFDPSSGWIWKRWKGTVFSETWDSCVKKMIYAVAVCFICSKYPALKDYLSGFNVLWAQLLSITTFTLTFFVNQSYALWRKCYELSRRLQGRLHDIDMTLAAHAARRPGAGPNDPSTYTAGSRQILELVSRWVRLFNLLTYGSFTRSHRPVLTPRGMRRLVERGLMTSSERDALVAAEIPATQRHNAILLWITRAFIEGREAGHFQGGAGFENMFLEKIHVTRGQYGAIGDELQGRMPLAYAHIVQVLVDAVLWMYPIMAYNSGMSSFVTVLGTGLLTISYQGLFDLAKQFLDPYDNESYGKGEDPLVVDTLIAETNAGSIRWMYGLEEMPVPYQRLKDGELSDYLLPVRGYSVEELDLMEEERLQKERDLQEKRDREEEERQKVEEEETLLRQAAEAMIESRMNTTADAMTSLSNATYTVAKNADFGSSSSSDLFSSAFGSATLGSGQAVNDILNNVYPGVGGFPDALIPDETAMANPSLEEVEETVVDEKVLDDICRIQFGGDDADDCDYDEMVEYIDGQDDVQLDEQGYVHTFDAFDPYSDLPWHDEVGTDGSEIRLSQMLANDVWEEEVEAAKDKETLRIRTYEDYIKRVDEIKEAERSELMETQGILMAAPGAEFESTSVKPDEEEVLQYDQTKLDGISQLWGLPPDDLSEIPGYEEPPLPDEDSFGGISQLWGESAEPSRTSYDETVAVDTDDSFSSLSQLWGEAIPDSNPEAGSSSSSVSQSFIAGDSDEALSWRDDTMAGDGKEPRMSQLLADEVWEEELEPVVMEPVTFQDYTKQVAEILEAEQEERLETEAIMNAPPGADMLELPDEEEETWLVAANSTEMVDGIAEMEANAVEMDALEMDTLEMDAPVVDDGLDVTTEEGVASNQDMDSPVGEDAVLDSDVNGDKGVITVDEDGMPVDN
jgi:hypothetical protein